MQYYLVSWFCLFFPDVLLSDIVTVFIFFCICSQDSQEKNANPVKAEEAKLKAKYPGLGQKPGGSDFLMKRLQKGVGNHRLSATWLERQVDVSVNWSQLYCLSINKKNELFCLVDAFSVINQVLRKIYLFLSQNFLPKYSAI